MRLFIENMGLNWASQYTKLKQRFKTCVVNITMQLPGDKQRRDVVCLALRKLAGWLQMVSVNKVKSEIREKVIHYQEKSDDVLYEYWTTGEVKRKTLVKPQPPQFRYIIKMEVYDKHLNKTEVFTGGTETPAGIIEGVARQYGYHVDNMISLPMNVF
ncbi:phage antirepressor N-terminal domain-containing protein [Xenorhabdus lircayensis]|uniref:Antirepressor protein ant N-terminal domain-containing protein n=1 Tax=Xenorhabdus lircayensis TaxID=2763499 RepID=A0ABS0U0M8_9GAMM|nr:hypothetical protein [Xenorhabdus lircayensis]